MLRKSLLVLALAASFAARSAPCRNAAAQRSHPVRNPPPRPGPIAATRSAFLRRRLCRFRQGRKAHAIGRFPARISLGHGAFDTGTAHSDWFDFGIHPLAGVEFSTRSQLYGFGGFGFDLLFWKHIVFTESEVVGLFDSGRCQAARFLYRVPFASRTWLPLR